MTSSARRRWPTNLRYLLTVLFSFGLPTGFTILLVRKSRGADKLTSNEKVLQVQKDLRCGQSNAEYVIQDIQLGGSYSFLVDSYKSRFHYWEMIDLFRKFFIVGAVVLFGRGTVLQLFVALMFSFFFFTAQMACWPMKLGE